MDGNPGKKKVEDAIEEIRVVLEQSQEQLNHLNELLSRVRDQQHRIEKVLDAAKQLKKNYGLDGSAS